MKKMKQLQEKDKMSYYRYRFKKYEQKYVGNIDFKNECLYNIGINQEEGQNEPS